MRKVFRAIAYVLVLWALLVMGGAHSTSAQGSQNRAGLVVQYADGSAQSFCLAFSGDTITGFDLLLKSGLDVKAETYGGMGGLVCKIGAVGCDYPGEVCACKSFGPEGIFWGYYHLRNGVWKSSSLGSGGYKVHNGEVDGWAWSGGKPPAVKTFDQICGVAEPQPTNTPRAATSTPRPPTPQPTFTAPPPTARPATSTPFFIPLQQTNTVQPVSSTRVVTKPRSTSTTQPPRPSPTRLTLTKTQITRVAPRQQTATSKPIPPTQIRSTATRKSAIIATTQTELPIQSTATVVAIPTLVATDTPTATDTPISTPTVVSSTSTRTETPVPAPTGTSSPTAHITATPLATSTRAAALPIGNVPQSSRAETAQTVSIVIVAAVTGGLLVWAGVMLAVRRSPGKRRGGTHV